MQANSGDIHKEFMLDYLKFTQSLILIDLFTYIPPITLIEAHHGIAGGYFITIHNKAYSSIDNFACSCDLGKDIM